MALFLINPKDINNPKEINDHSDKSSNNTSTRDSNNPSSNSDNNSSNVNNNIIFDFANEDITINTVIDNIIKFGSKSDDNPRHHTDSYPISGSVVDSFDNTVDDTPSNSVNHSNRFSDISSDISIVSNSVVKKVTFSESNDIFDYVPLSREPSNELIDH